ncbi:hypothetical protein [Kribbella sp. NPDC051770]|uniref:hypothetical protein n=1 Tax=Kribbella sp. NPDC051770 TaxID=3155413 RepID=UPI003422A43F
MLQKVWADPRLAGLPGWLDVYLPIAEAADGGVLYVDLAGGPAYGSVCEWWSEEPEPGRRCWGGVGAMLDDVAAAMVDRRPLTRPYGRPLLPELDVGYLRWFDVYD